MFDYEKYSPHHDWHESVFEMAKEAGAILGIDIDDIHYSGFWSQGDGASFTGSYAYAKGAAKHIRAEYPSHTELHAIADTLQHLQRVNFYRLTATITQRGRYFHEMTMQADVEDSADSYRDIGEDASDSLLEAMRDFARWIYATLEKEYEYESAWQMASAWQKLADEAAAEKQAARQLIRDMRASHRDGVPASICDALRSTVRRHLAAMAAALEQRTEIADNFAYWTEDRSQLGVAEFAAANL